MIPIPSAARVLTIKWAPRVRKVVMTRLKCLSLLSLQLLGPALRIQVAAFDVLMVIGKSCQQRGDISLDYILNTESCHLCSVPDYQDLDTFSMRI